MIRSMTGFGEAERETPVGFVRLELKTVNHRFFNANLKTPAGYQRHERELVEALKRHLSRGHVSAHLTVSPRAPEDDGAIALDLEAAKRYKALVETLGTELGLEGPVDLATLLRVPGFAGVLRGPEEPEPVDVDTLVSLTEEAASAAVEQREAEGRRLRDDLEERLRAIGALLDEVERRGPERLVAERDRLRAAVGELTEGLSLDEDRLAREVAVLADKWDLNEEVVRFRSHVELFAEALASEGGEPVGKRLGFLVQEMHREANTIGSKANDAEISHAAVALKEEIERVREQVENVE